jgi:hypothetical protein
MARTLSQARADAAENVRELHKGQRRAAHLKLASLRAAEERLRALRGVELREARDVCKANVREAFEQSRARFQEATTRARAARDASRSAARSACDATTAKAKAHRDREIAEAHAIRVAEWKEQQELASLDSWAKAKSRSRAKKVERAAESDGEVESNLDPSLVSLWRQVRKGIKGSARQSRTEEFLRYVEEHPDEVSESWDADDLDLAELEREQARFYAEGNPAPMLPVLVLANPSRPPQDFDKVRRQLHRAHQATVNYHRRENETYAQAEARRDKLQARYEQLTKDFDRLYPYEHNPTTQRPARAGKEGKNMAQTPAQKAASKRNIKKAIAKNRKKAKPRKRATNPESNPKKKRAKRPARARKSAARRRKTSSNPSHARKPRRRRARRNPEGGKKSGRGMVAAQIGGGVLVGAAGAGAAEYLMSGTTMLATPPRRAIAHAVVGTAIGAAGVVWPRAAAFFAGAAGAFFGVAGKNTVQALWSGSPKETKPAGNQTGSGTQPALAAVVLPSRMLPQGSPMHAVTMNRSQLRAVVMRGGKY